MPFMGMRGTGDWATDERPTNYRQGILRLYPNGGAPLTAIMSKMGEEKVDDPQYTWWTKLLPTQGGSYTAGVVYTDSGLTSAYTSGGTANQVVYLKLPAAATDTLAGVDEFRVGHQITFRCSTDPTMVVNGKVVGVVPNGSSSYIAVKLLEADDNSTTKDLSDSDFVQITGNINSEGAAMPDGVAYDPSKFTNYTQIFRSPLSITRTAMETKLRTEQSYKEMKREALEIHSIEMEKAFIHGIPTENIGSNGKKERTTGGLLYWIRTYASANCLDYISDTDFSGQSWVQGGEDWFDKSLEKIFRYGSQEKLAFCGSGALLGIQKLAKTYGNIQLQVTTTSYGIKVVEWITPFGVLYLKTHPLFSYNVVDRYNAIVFEPKLLKYKYITDTTFKPDTSSGNSSVDGKNEEYLTEAGLELHHPLCAGYLTNLNKTNIV